MSDADNNKKNAAQQPSHDIPVIEESLEYCDIDTSAFDDNRKKKVFEDYLESITEQTGESEDSVESSAPSLSERIAAIRERTTQKRKKLSFAGYIKQSAIGRFLLGYDAHNKMLNDSSLISAKREKSEEDAMTKVAKRIEGSKISACIQEAVERLTSVSSKCCGLFLLAYAIVSVLIYFSVIMFNISRFDSIIGFLVFGIVSMIVATFLMMGDSSISNLFTFNKFSRLIFVYFLGYRLSENKSNEPIKQKASHLAIFAVAGALVGALTIVVPPTAIWLTALSFIFVLLSFSSPEFCFNVTLLILPFTILFGHRTMPIAVLVLLCFFCYMRKLLLRKRSFTFEAIDFYVMLFAGVYFLSGITSIGGVSSPYIATEYLILILGYFLAANLLKSERNIVSTNRVICFSAFLVSVVGLVEYFSGRAKSEWIDKNFFGYSNGRIVSLFENPNILAVYLIFAVPFVIGEIKRNFRSIGVITDIVNLVAIITAIILTQSRGAYLSLIFIIVSMFLFASHKPIKRVMFIIAAIPYVITILPSFVGERFMSVFSKTFDSSVSYRLGVWQGCLRMIKKFFFLGIGGGDSSFSSIYPDYATAGTEGAVHAHNIFLQCMVESGIFGFIIFIVLIAVFIQMNTSKARYAVTDLRLFGFSAFSAVMAQLIFGATDYVWYDRRMFFLFFVVIGICVAASRQNKDNEIAIDENPDKNNKLSVDETV